MSFFTICSVMLVWSATLPTAQHVDAATVRWPSVRQIGTARYTVAIDAKDIVVRDRAGAVAFSARAFVDAQQTALKRLEGPDLKSVRHRFSFVSLAGPYLAVRDETDINPAEPIPGGSTRFWTIDLRRSQVYRFDDAEPLRPAPKDGTLVDLRRFYSPAALARAIGATRLGARGPNSPAERDLRYVLSDLTRRGQGDGRCYGADQDILSSFAITGLAADRIEVDLGMSGQASCRYALTVLRITLPRKGSMNVRFPMGPVVNAKPYEVLIEMPVR